MSNPYDRTRLPELAEQVLARQVAVDTGLGLVQVSPRRWIVVDATGAGGHGEPDGTWVYAISYRRLSREHDRADAGRILARLLKEARESAPMARMVRSDMSYALSHGKDPEA